MSITDRVMLILTYNTTTGFTFTIVEGATTHPTTHVLPTSWTGGRIGVQWSGTTFTVTVNGATVLTRTTAGGVTIASRDAFSMGGGESGGAFKFDNFTLNYI